MKEMWAKFKAVELNTGECLARLKTHSGSVLLDVGPVFVELDDICMFQMD